MLVVDKSVEKGQISRNFHCTKMGEVYVYVSAIGYSYNKYAVSFALPAP